MTAIDQEYKRNASAHRAFTEMAQASRLTVQKYEQGLVEYSDVLDAETRRLQAQTDMVQSNSALYTNIITFYKAIGGSVTEDALRQSVASSR